MTNNRTGRAPQRAPQRALETRIAVLEDRLRPSPGPAAVEDVLEREAAARLVEIVERIPDGPDGPDLSGLSNAEAAELDELLDEISVRVPAVDYGARLTYTVSTSPEHEQESER